MSSTVPNQDASGQKRRVRRAALLYGGIAIAFYLGFIVLAIVRNFK